MTNVILQFLANILSLPKKITDALVDLAGGNVPDRDEVFISMGVCIFLFLLPVIIDRSRSVSSKIISAYGAFCFFYLVIIAIFLTFPVDGELWLVQTDTLQAFEDFSPARLGSNSCGVDDHNTTAFCTKQFPKIVKNSYAVISANCGSGVESVSIDDDRQNCVNVKTHLLGCGYDHLPFGINNCRGRGWLEYRVRVYGSVPNLTVVRRQDIHGYIRRGYPLIFKLNGNAPTENQKIEYKLRAGNAMMSSQMPTNGNFSTELFEDGVQVSYARIRSNVEINN